MTPTELEDRLRGDLRARQAEVPPAPVDLADRVRRRHRAQRRAQLLTAVAAVAVVAVFAGAATLVTRLQSDRDTTDRPTGPGILGWPTRGSLADDQEWLDGIRRLDWEIPPDVPGEVPVPAVADRHVAYAGEAPDGQPNGQVALVVGEADGQVLAAWFTGYPGATPEEMQLAAMPQPVDPTEPLAYLGPVGITRFAIARVVVAAPDTTLELSTSPIVEADGTETVRYIPLPTTDGTFSEALDPYWAQISSIRARGSAGQPDRVVPTVVAFEEPGLTDPESAPAVEEDAILDEAIGVLLSIHVLTEAQAEPTVLATATTAGGDRVTLFGFTFPSGATGVWLLRVEDQGVGLETSLSRLPHAPAGTRLEDRLLAVPVSDTELAVRAPAPAVRAEVLTADGEVLGTVTLDDAVYVGEVPGGAASVRAVDASGRTVAEAAIEEVVTR